MTALYTSSENRELKLAFDYLMHTQQSVFLTGKAGTGKTTFLREFTKQTPKRFAIVAPTGVAAMNAGGVTIHSLFQLPFTPYIPSESADREYSNSREIKKISKEKISLIRSLDLLIIDEISMVRADLLDAVDAFCRKYRDRYKPFGGLQLLLIGDMYQLAPVAKDEDWKFLKDHYESVYFFHSHAFQKLQTITIELKNIYRQSDQKFINILNEVRQNNLSIETLDVLHQRYIPNFEKTDPAGYVTLTTHNAIAKRINDQRLQTLKSNLVSIQAKIENNFPEYMYPTEALLELKKGAQVMFIKNDSSKNKLYYNGKIGVISEVDWEKVVIQTDDDAKITVYKERWENIKYTLNLDTKMIDEEVIGSFVQYPLRLAWAITIHKSQGLTFDKLIIDAEASFSSGQVYVALSRCKSLEGLVLISRINQKSLKSSDEVTKFSTLASQQKTDQRTLKKAQYDFQTAILRELFESSKIRTAFDALSRFVAENSPPLPQSLLSEIDSIYISLEQPYFHILNKFNQELNRLLEQDILPEENAQLVSRLVKAAHYFDEQLHNLVIKPLKQLTIASDNKNLINGFKKCVEQLEFEAFKTSTCLNICKQHFNVLAIIQARSNAFIDFENRLNRTDLKQVAPKDVAHPDLYAALAQLRTRLAEEQGVDAYRVIHSKTIREIANHLPATEDALLQIKGMGKVMVSRIGKAILAEVLAYCGNNEVTPNLQVSTPKTTAKKSDTSIPSATKQQTFDLYQANKSIDEIASIRGITRGTVETHLAHYVAKGILPVSDFVTKDRLQMIAKVTADDGASVESVAKWKSMLPPDYTYGELKMYRAFLDSLKS